MARNSKLKTDEKIVEKKKSTRLFQEVLLWTLIPLLFTTMVLLIIAYVADVNVFDKAKEWTKSLPFINEKQVDDENVDDLVIEERVVELQAEIQDKEAQLFKLQEDLAKSDDEKQALLDEQKSLLAQIEALKMEKDDYKRDMKEIISTFEKMSAKSAAPVITKMSDAEAIEILSSLKPEVLAPILEKMSPEDAAKYTSLMTK
ncbi:MotE family protein [Sporosarcina sp. SAFN-015]|uniref:MotE family protein n=1 Tax=Sporosarcina sp. SAFN-015 TaxID=3387274 RepID=UPI003F7F0A63